MCGDVAVVFDTNAYPKTEVCTREALRDDNRSNASVESDIFRTLFGAVAQLGEHLVCNQGVAGSIPVRSTRVT